MNQKTNKLRQVPNAICLVVTTTKVRKHSEVSLMP